MQLSNASVDSLADGVLTLSFVQPGTAKGFLSGGYDKVLAVVLAEMFGVTPAITTTVGAASPDLQAGTAPRNPPPTAPREAEAGSMPEQKPRSVTRRRAPTAASGDEPASDDLPVPEALTGTDLIERELGGRIIQELDGQ